MHDQKGDLSLGTARIIPNDNVIAGSKGTWRIIYTAGSKGVKVGGSIRITIPHGFTAPQTTAFFDPGFTTLEYQLNNIELELSVKNDVFCRIDKLTGHSGAWGRNIFIEVKDRDLIENESFTIVYGNYDYYGGEPFNKSGSEVRELSGIAEFIVAVDYDGTRSAPFTGFLKIQNSPKIKVLPEKYDHSKYIISTLNFTHTNRSNPHDKNISAIEVGIDKFNNPLYTKCLELKLKQSNSNEYIVYGRSFDIKQKKKIRSNPIILPTKNNIPYHLYWGDIHGHTEHSDGIGTIEDYYGYAKDVGLLNFSAITDHDDIGPRLFDTEWDLLKKAANNFNKPLEFVTFIGHEYRNGSCDMNIYYPENTGEILRGTDENYKDPLNLLKIVKEYKGMIIPHMHFGADFSGFDPDTYRVLEIFSQHGSAEFPGCNREIPYLRKQVQKTSKTNENAFIHEILNLDYRLGFTAGSDTHSARPGFSDWTRTSRTFLGGLTAVYAKSLTREDVWNALFNRRCYATTGNRSILEFSINGHFMGSEFTITIEEKIEITIKCYADGELEQITLYKSGNVLYSQSIQGIEFEKTYMDKNKLLNESSFWYYVRFDLKEGQMVWSSPIWIDFK